MISSPEPDTYGPYARASLLADYVELLALKGQPVRRTTVADFLADSGAGWDLELIQPAENDDPDGQMDGLAERIAVADERASIVFRQLDERRHVLTDHYPFEIADDEISLGPDVDHESNAYVAVLALTIAHAFQVEAPSRPEILFEETVTDVLRERGLSSVGFAAVRRECGSFEAALATACREIGLRAAPDAAPRRKQAHDEGVDVLCHLGWEQDLRRWEQDLRPGSWGFIGQVTVARSDRWDQKIKEPSPAPWAKRIGTRIRPLPFLAVPHHVELPMMERLTEEGQAVVLDRLRLVRFKEEIKAGELEIVRAVVGEEVEPLMG